MDLEERAECLDLVHGFAKSQMLFSAVEMGIFEQIEEHGSLSAEDIAKRLDSDRDATERLLNACTSIGFLLKSVKGLYSNTTKSKWCLKSTRGSLYGDILLNKNCCYSIYGYLSKAVKTGNNMAQEVFGVSGDKLYTFGGGYYRDKRSTEDFTMGMEGCSYGLADKTIKLFDLHDYNTVCDLGGGSGVFSVALAKMYPQMDIILFDLPEVIEVNKNRSTCFPSNVRFAAGDFYKDILPKADLYMLNHVLEDWSEYNGKTLLRKIFLSLSKGGSLLICEYCLPPNKVAETFAHVVDLNQLASCEGKMRTADEWTMFMKEAADFSHVVHRGGISYFGDIIMAKK